MTTEVTAEPEVVAPQGTGLTGIAPAGVGSATLSPEPVDDPAGRVAAEIALLLRLADRNARSAELEGTLDRSAYLVLSVLASTGPTNINTIAAHLRLDASTVTRQVVTMEVCGLVARCKDPHDGRATLVVPTEHGRSEHSRATAARAALYRSVLSDWSADERVELATVLHRLNTAMDAHACPRGRGD